MSVESCSSSMACDMEEVISECSRMMREKEETTSEASWTAMTQGKENEVWRLEPDGEAEKPEAAAPWSGVKGVSVNPEGESCPRAGASKDGKEGKRESHKNGREGGGENVVEVVRRSTPSICVSSVTTKV